jgi:glycosyltransferase involved in cell wall biosynthesis
MIIHYYQQFFTGPDAPGTLTPRKLMRRLAEAGHHAHVIATDYNVYNEQTEPEEHVEFSGSGSWTSHRLPSARGLRRGLGARLRTYTGFAVSAYRFGAKLPKADVVIGSIQPLFTGLVAQRLARRWQAPFLLEIRDLWPDALEAKKAISPLQAWPLRRIANHLYARADRIVSLTPGIKRVIAGKGVFADKIDVIPNGFDPGMYVLPAGARERVREEFGWNGRFVAVFTGTHVEVTAVETIVRAAAVLRDRPNIHFALFGKGQRKAAAMQMARDMGLENITFHEPVSKSRIPEILAAADAALMTLFKSPLIDIYFENKLVDYMGAGKPILAAMDGMQSELICRHKAGRAVGSLDHQGLAGLVAEAASKPASLEEMGRNGRLFAASRLLLANILNQYIRRIEEVAQGLAGGLPAIEMV